MNAANRLRARISTWLRAAASRSRLDDEMEQELAFHIENRVDDLMQRGLSRDEATRRARIELGSMGAHKEEMRASFGVRLWDDLRADLRYATRMLLKAPAFTAIAVGSLALGIGANTAIFTLAKQVLLDRLAVPHPEQLQLFRWVAPRHNVVHHSSGVLSETATGQTSTSFPYPAYQQLRRDNPALGGLFAFHNAGHLAATIDGQAVAVQGQMVSGNYYQELGVQPALGRAILPSDDSVPGGGAVVVLSNGFWATHFGRASSAIGRVIRLNAMPVTIIGVNPPQFTGAGDPHLSPDIFFPFSMQPVLLPQHEGSSLGDSQYWWMQIMARSRDGITVPAAQAALDTLFQSWLQANAGSDRRANGVQANSHARTSSQQEAFPHVVLEDGSRGLNMTADGLARPVYVLLALTGLVLLLACANIASLLLARFAARQRELGVRMALGAGRKRILRQVLTESLLLASVGGLAGFALGYLGRNLLPRFISPPGRPAIFNGHIDARVLVFTAALSILTGLLFGIMPAWKATRTDVSSELKDSAQTATHRRKGLAGKSIVSFQVALSTLLVVGAFLFIRTLANLRSVDPGFRTDHLVLFDINLPNSQYAPPADVNAFRSIEEKLGACPGVASVALSSDALIANKRSIDDFVRLDRPTARNSGAWSNSVSQNFFPAMGIPILAGRGFAATDTPTAPKVGVINRALAHEYFPGENPIGKSFRGYYFVDQIPFQIVGIAADTHYDSLRRSPPPTYYVLYSQLPQAAGRMTYEVRTHVAPAALVPLLRRAVQSVDANLPLLDVRTQADQIDDTIQQERLLASLTVSFGVLALVLASIGIYGIMAYTVAPTRSASASRSARSPGRSWA